MIKTILFSNAFPSRHRRITVFYEKYLTDSSSEPRWRYGFISSSKGFILRDNLKQRPRMKERTIWVCN